MLLIHFDISIKQCKEDYRPLKWPIKYPYWCSGEDNDNFYLRAYVDSENELIELWPEALITSTEEVDEIKFTSRFPKPSWYEDVQ